MPEAPSVLEPVEVAHPLVALGLLGVTRWLANPAGAWRRRAGVLALAADGSR